MPRILINERDYTNPGTAGSYANYAVLITGFAGTPSTDADATIIKPDSNGVYEFTSAKAFSDTIGLAAPDISDTICHYGNQMAFELLNMGYTVIFKTIDNVADLADEAFWEIFKDRANYDFRFVTHGLLRSTTASAETLARLAELEEALAELAKIEEAARTKGEQQPADSDFEFVEYVNLLYQGGTDGEESFSSAL